MIVKSYILRLLTSILAITCIFLSGCNRKDEIHVSFKVLDESTNIIDIISEKYSNKDMFEEVQENKYTLDELNKIYPIEFVKKNMNEDELYFDVAYMTSNGYIILHYDEAGNYVFGQDVIAEILLNEFDALNIGDSINDVKKIDEHGMFTFLYTGRVDLPKISYHYTVDGYMVMIHYDSSCVITEIENKLI